MTLAGRLTAFFLAALAAVLVGFSASVYLLARAYLHRQVDDRLEAALDTLSAAAEVTPEGVEWERRQLRLTLGQDSDTTQVRWVVYDEQGRPVDRSGNLGGAGLFDESAPDANEETAAQFTDAAGEPWLLRQRQLRPANPPVSPVRRSPPKEGEDEVIHAALTLRVAAPLRPVHATTRALAAGLSGLALAAWLTAALLGRRLCRRALAPVTRMADAARAMSAADLAQRLPGPGTGDALEDLGRAFNDLLCRVQEAFERQRRFTGDASHQLRTPLAAMLGQVEVALRRERSPEEYQRVLAVVSDQTRRLQHLVETLLFLARADAEAAAPELTAVDVAGWLREHLRGWAARPRAADLRLEAGEGGPLLARAHGPLLGQVVDVLLDNACKYSRPGTPITVSLRAAGDHVELLVEDQGCGIDPGELPRVFDPFYRCPRGREPAGFVGVGLGLAIARRVTAALGGSIEVESEPGRGSRFLVRLAGSAGSTVADAR